MKQAELQDELKKRGIELTGEETYAQLQKQYSEIKKKEAVESEVEGAHPNKKTALNYVWVKLKSYVDEDGKLLLQPGIYGMTDYTLSKFPRLINVAKKSSTTVEIFDSVPSRKLAEIATWAGVDPNKYRDDTELLRIIVKEPRPYSV